MALPYGTLVGSSLGGNYALHLAAESDPRLTHLLLLGATGVAVPGGRATAPMALLSRRWIGRVAGVLTPRMRPPFSRRFFASALGRPAVDAVPDEMFEVTAALADSVRVGARRHLPGLSRRRPCAALIREHLGTADDASTPRR